MKYFLPTLSSKTTLKVMGASSLAVAMAFVPVVSTFAVDSTTPTTTQQTSTEQTRLQDIITKGTAEIDRRLARLNTLSAKITAATKLSTADKTTLSNEVASTISGLTALKTKLASETTLAGARQDATEIYSDYRVYALVAPKIGLIRIADDQQAVEAKLTALATKLQTRITEAKQAGHDTTQLQSQLDDLTSKVTAAQAISSKVESSVIGLQPTDYNSDHKILSGYNDQLKTARTDNQAAFTDAKNIIASLKSLKNQ